MSTPTFEPTVFVDLTREQIVAILNGGSPPSGAHPLSAAEMNRIGVALQVFSTNLLALQGTAQTSAQVQAAVSAAVSGLVSGAPAALDTFVELAAALGNDPNKITALSTAIAAKYTKPGTGIPAADLASDVPTAAQVAANTAATQTNATAIAALPTTYQQTLPVVAPITAAATLVGDRHTPIDASSGALTVTLPTPTRAGQQIRVEKVDATTNAITISGTLRGAADTLSLRYTSEVRTLIAESLTSWRVASGNTPKSGLDLTYANTNDARLSDQRTPTDGSVTDAKVAAAAGIAQSKIAGLGTALAAKADLVSGVIPTAQIPALALVDTVTVASQAAMLALTSTQVQRGDIAVRTDGAGTFVLNAADPSVLGNWVRLNAPTDVVTSVNGQQGTVVLNAANVGASPAGAYVKPANGIPASDFAPGVLTPAPTPTAQNLLTWSFDPIGIQGGSNVGNGVLQVARVRLLADTTITNLWLSIQTAGSGLSSGACLAALYDANRNLLATTTDQSTAWTTVGPKTMPLTSAVAVAAGEYWVGFWSNGSTNPIFQRASAFAAINAGATVPRFGTSSTGLSTTAPATAAAYAASANSWWVALS